MTRVVTPLLSDSFVDGSCQLVGAGSTPALAVVAAQNVRNLFRIASLHELTDRFKIPVAASNIFKIVDPALIVYIIIDLH